MLNKQDAVFLKKTAIHEPYARVSSGNMKALKLPKIQPILTPPPTHFYIISCAGETSKVTINIEASLDIACNL